MPLKINIAEKGKTYHIEVESDFFIGKKIKEKVNGEDFYPDLEGYELEITGASDSAGFPALESIKGEGLKRVLFTKYGKGLKKKPKKEGKKKITRNRPKGLRLKKTIHGNILSNRIVQINLNIIKPGNKKLSEIFPDQGHGKGKKEEQKQETKVEEKTETKQEQPKEEKEEIKKEQEKPSEEKK